MSNQKRAIAPIKIAQMAASGEMFSKSQVIDPQKAQELLDLMPKNRQVNKNRVTAYADAMLAGKWLESPQGLIFNKDGRLIDGQHRLLAVIKSGIAQTFYCTFNADDDTKLVMDSGMARSIAQTGQVVGLQTNQMAIAIAKMMLITPGDTKLRKNLDGQYILEFFEKYQDGIIFAQTKYGGRGSIALASVRGAIARAYYTVEDQARLSRFIEVLDTGFSEGSSESAAIALRNLCLQKKGRDRDAYTITLYCKAIYAIDKFLKGEACKQVYEAKKQVFPIKEDFDLIG